MIYNHLFGFLALATYATTLIPSNIIKIFPHTKKWQINTFLLKKRRLLGLMAFSLSVNHALISLNKYEINLLHLGTYNTYFTGIISLAIFSLLAFTSNNWSIRQLKHKWKILHQLTYVAMFLLLWHILSMMKGSWTWLTPIALQLLMVTSLIFLSRLFINSKETILNKLQVKKQISEEIEIT
jgi:sulfoxide reductase heme-binding subunit YedZ